MTITYSSLISQTLTTLHVRVWANSILKVVLLRQNFYYSPCGGVIALVYVIALLAQNTDTIFCDVRDDEATAHVCHNFHGIM